MSKPKILFSGATGFIGSHLARHFNNTGYEVGTFVRSSSDLQRVDDIIDDIKRYEVDLSDSDGVFNAIKDFKPQVIIHLATYYKVSHAPEDINAMISTNILGTINLLQAAVENKVSQFVNTSTCFVYGNKKEKLTEETPTHPINLYALTKIQAEEACDFFSGHYNLPCVSLRIFAPYGPGDHQRRLIPSVIRSFHQGLSPKMTSGEQEWDFVYISDIVDAYDKVLKAKKLANHEIINIGSGAVASVKDVGDKIKELMETDASLQWGAVAHRENEIWYTCGDIGKAKKVLNWEPKVHILDQGLKMTVEYFKELYNEQKVLEK